MNAAELHAPGHEPLSTHEMQQLWRFLRDRGYAIEVSRAVLWPHPADRCSTCAAEQEAAKSAGLVLL